MLELEVILLVGAEGWGLGGAFGVVSWHESGGSYGVVVGTEGGDRTYSYIAVSPSSECLFTLSLQPGHIALSHPRQ